MKLSFILLVLLLCFSAISFAQPATAPATMQSLTPVSSASTTAGGGGNAAIKPTDSHSTAAVSSPTSTATSPDKNKCNCIPFEKKDRDFGLGWLLIFTPLLLFIIFILVILRSLQEYKLKEALSENIIDKITINNTQYDAGKLAAMISDLKSNTATVANLVTIFPPTIEVSNTTNIDTKTPMVLTNAINDSLKSAIAFTSADAEYKKCMVAASTIDVSKPDDKRVADEATVKAKGVADSANTAYVKANEVLCDIIKTSSAVTNNFRQSSSRLIAFITSMFALVIVAAMSCFFIYHYMYTGCPPDMSALTTMLITLGVGVTPYAFNKVAEAVKNNKSDSFVYPKCNYPPCEKRSPSM